MSKKLIRFLPTACILTLLILTVIDAYNSGAHQPLLTVSLAVHTVALVAIIASQILSPKEVEVDEIISAIAELSRKKSLVEKRQYFSLSPGDQALLQSLPETGMGYQLLFGKLMVESGVETGLFVAINSEIMTPYTGNEFIAFPEQVEELRLASLVDVSVLTAQRINTPSTSEEPGGEYRRFSAYANDRRVRPDMGLLPGTYVTTVEDARHVLSGSDAVRRYALPDPTSANNCFFIRVGVRGTPRYLGVVQPQFGQPGGGVELIFDLGAPPGSVYNRAQIPT